MSALVVLPDPVRLVSRFFREQPEVAALVDDRVYSVLPPKPTWPAVRIVQWTETPVIGRPLWLTRAGCQVDCWAPTKYVASTVSRTLRGVAAARLSELERHVVTGVEFGSVADSPDTDYEPALQRFRFDLFVTFHPDRADVPLGFPREPDVPAAS